MTSMLEKAAIAAAEAAETVPAELHGYREGWLIVVSAVLLATREVPEHISWRALERLGGDACCFDFTYTRAREIHTATMDSILNEGLE